MDINDIFQLTDSEKYHHELLQKDKYYEHRIKMLKLAQGLFQSGKKLSDFTLAERSIILGQNSLNHSQYGFDTNLFGAPGGSGEVKNIVKSQYAGLNNFYAAIPRNGIISDDQYEKLVDIFQGSIKAIGCKNMPFVLFTRILAVTRPDTFATAASKALDPICESLGLNKIGNSFEHYWHLFLKTLHQLPLFKESLGHPDQPLVALIDGLSEKKNDDDNAVTTGITATNSIQQSGATTNMSLNQILYGPPGTGKTYKTIEAAVKAAEPTFTWSSRIDLKAKYDSLVNEKRIRFVTFHQSFGYEEFVEGIKPDVSDSDSICYSVESGVFKQICEDASLSTLPDNSSINKDGRVWKISIEGAHQNRTKEYCLKENLAAIGWCETGDLSPSEKNQYFQELGKNAQNSLLYFSQEMMEGDLVLCIDSATSIEAVGVVTGPYRYESKGLPVGRTDYTHQRPVQWLQQGFSVDLKELNDNKRFSLPTCYPLERMTVSDVLRHLEANNIQLPEYQSTGKKQNYVIVIDEINRGNISKIFGELITLIEPSKRDGNEEALKLSLPYSGKPFSVPNNLYIIGTMNTADRSLTMLDTALRRRFDFVEMMPDPTTLESTVVKGIDLTQLLTKLNERIEVLYDREHTLGHAFLIPVKEALADGEDVAFHKLIGVFQNKIIPLLQEYFFEDWQKIRLVLGDNQKPAELQFITEETLSDQRLSDLFGSGHGLNQYGDEQCQFKLKPFTDDDNQNVWAKPEAYLAIYNKSVKQAEVKHDQRVTEGTVA